MMSANITAASTPKVSIGISVTFALSSGVFAISRMPYFWRICAVLREAAPRLPHEPDRRAIRLPVLARIEHPRLTRPPLRPRHCHRLLHPHTFLLNT